MKRCINIDWLQLYCTSETWFTLPRLLSQAGYMVKLRGAGTRHFRQLYDVYTADNTPYLEIQADPYSLKHEGGIFELGAMLIKLCNKFCYEENCVNKLAELLRFVNVQIKSISRLDLACDFQYFDNNLKPSTLIHRFKSCDYWKIGVKEYAENGRQEQSIQYEYLRFGSGSSKCSVYLYNKSKEMRDVKHKPWIEDAWVDCGYQDAGKKSTDVWRLEFSLKTDARHLIRYEDKIVKVQGGFLNQSTGEVLSELQNYITDKDGKIHIVEPINLNTIETPEGIMSLFFRIYHHYFIFRYRQKGKRKHECKRVELFKVMENDKNYVPVTLTTAQDSNKMDRFVRDYLNKMWEEKPELGEHIHAVRMEIIKKFRLT